VERNRAPASLLQQQQRRIFQQVPERFQILGYAILESKVLVEPADRADPLWFTFLVAVFGLHYLARFRVRE
jgi:hypothetical protein